MRGWPKEQFFKFKRDFFTSFELSVSFLFCRNDIVFLFYVFLTSKLCLNQDMANQRNLHWALPKYHMPCRLNHSRCSVDKWKLMAWIHQHFLKTWSVWKTPCRRQSLLGSVGRGQGHKVVTAGFMWILAWLQT